MNYTNLSIDDLNLSMRAIRCISNILFSDIKDKDIEAILKKPGSAQLICALKERDFRGIRNVGQKTIIEIRGALICYGLDLKNDDAATQALDHIKREILFLEDMLKKLEEKVKFCREIFDTLTKKE